MHIVINIICRKFNGYYSCFFENRKRHDPKAMPFLIIHTILFYEPHPLNPGDQKLKLNTL